MNNNFPDERHKIIDDRLRHVKGIKRAMQSYTLMLYEFVFELNPKNVLEIGVNQGQSTRAILLGINDNIRLGKQGGKLTSIDFKSYLSARLDKMYDDLKPIWNFVCGDSRDENTIKKVKESLVEGEYYDILLIDGGHDYKTVKADWNNYMPMVKAGGLILLHDTCNKNETVNQLWDEITFEKFNLDWGRAGRNVIPGIGIVRKG